MRTLVRAFLIVLAATAIAGAQRGGDAPPADAGPFGALRWRSAGPPRGGRSLAVAGSVARPNEYYMGATGGGLWKTTDGGTTWRPVTDGSPVTSSSVGAVAVAASNPDIVYIGTGEADIRGNIIQGDGAYKSIDAGKTWTKVGLAETQNISKIRVHAQIEADDGGFFMSSDAGATWTRVSERRDLRQRAFYYTHVFADPKVKDTVYELNVNFHKSIDAGKTWTTLNPPHGDNHDMWIASNDSNRMIEANDGGANVSVNGGETWTAETMPTAQFYHVITTKHVPYHICGAQQDNSTACVSSQPAQGGPGGSGGGADQVFYSVGGGESGYVASDPRSPDIFYAGSYGGLTTRLDRRP